MKSYNPAPGWCFLQGEEVSDTTPAGIIKPVQAVERERSLGAEQAPQFKVVAVGPDASDFAYPTVGSSVFVLNDPKKIVAVNKKELTIFAHVDVIVGSVSEVNA